MKSRISLLLASFVGILFGIASEFAWAKFRSDAILWAGVGCAAFSIGMGSGFFFFSRRAIMKMKNRTVKRPANLPILASASQTSNATMRLQAKADDSLVLVQ